MTMGLVEISTFLSVQIIDPTLVPEFMGSTLFNINPI
jgi:hypothetical protein